MSNTLAATATLANTSPIVANLVRAIKYADKNEVRWSAYVAEFGVTLENHREHAVALADLAFPAQAGTPQKVRDENGKQTRTEYGNRVNTIATGLKRNLPKADKAETVEPDRLAALVRAAERATEAGHTPEQIMAALATVLDA